MYVFVHISWRALFPCGTTRVVLAFFCAFAFCLRICSKKSFRTFMPFARIWGNKSFRINRVPWIQNRSTHKHTQVHTHYAHTLARTYTHTHLQTCMYSHTRTKHTQKQTLSDSCVCTCSDRIIRSVKINILQGTAMPQHQGRLFMSLDPVNQPVHSDVVDNFF